MIDLYNVDFRTLSTYVNPGSVDLILTDPPYNIGNFMRRRGTCLGSLRSNFFVDAGWDNTDSVAWESMMCDFFKMSTQILRSGGSVLLFMAVVNVGKVITLAERYGLYYKTTGIWHKTNPMPRNMKIQFVNSTECWVYFTYGAKCGTFNGNGKLHHDFVECSVATRTERRFGKHPTQKPEKLMEYFLNLLSNAGDCVVDPFMGSGTTGVVAERLDRNFIGCEIDKSYFEIAQSRIGGKEK